MSGVEDRNRLLDAGFTSTEVGQWEQGQRETLAKAGFTQDEIGKHFQDPNPDMSRATGVARAGINHLSPDQKQQFTSGPLDAFTAGLQTSVSGLALRGRLPDKILP